MAFEIPHVASISDPVLAARVQHLLDHKTKPVGSLGMLEQLAHRMACILGTEQPMLEQPQMVVFAADHGLAQRGVSAYPVDVTWQMVENFLAGGAAVSVLARQHGIALHVVDCGVAKDFASREQAPQGLAGNAPRLWRRKVAYGTHDCSQGVAMQPLECALALRNGAEVVKALPGNALLLGEMGIGNTSTASLLLAKLCGTDVRAVTGMGTGLDPAGVERKIAILQQVLQLHRHVPVDDPLAVLTAMGGLEVATMVGAVLQAAVERRVIVVDGFITSAAVLVASRLQPAVLERCVYAHRSGEPGHNALLQALDAKPLLDWQLRLGEGSGAATVWPLLPSACAVLREMASFSSAGVATKNAGVAL